MRQSIRRLWLSPFLLHRDRIRGYVYDVASGLMDPVEGEGGPAGA